MPLKVCYYHPETSFLTEVNLKQRDPALALAEAKHLIAAVRPMHFWLEPQT